MADRAVGKNDEGTPREVFDLDKDERWQARLEEARARREVALREKAAGKPQAPRPKPWEIEGEDGPKPIEPIIQERGDDKFDFADRLEQLRDGDNAAPEKPDAAAVPPAPAPKQKDVTTARKRSKPRSARTGNTGKPERPPAGDAIERLRPPAPSAPAEARKPPAPRRERQKPSLIIPGAPDVAEIAARYADTLKPDADVVPPLSEAPEPEPAAPPETAKAEPRAGTRKHWTFSFPELATRPGVRPLGMAWGLLALAALPLTTEAPPLEKGPSMPIIATFPAPPALGITWSLYSSPVQTSSEDWEGAPGPAGLEAPAFDPPATLLSGVATPQIPVPEERSGSLPRAAEEPHAELASVPVLEDPAAPAAPPTAVEAPPVLEKAAPLPEVRPAPARPLDAAPLVEAAKPAISAPLRPLRITILAPPRADPAEAERFAADVPAKGHELVRIREVDFPISERNLRYFHDADRAEAARLARAYGAELRDFTWFRPQPVPGTAELWLSGAGTAPAAAPEEDIPFVVIRPADIPEQSQGLLNRVMEGVGNALGNTLGLPRGGN